jgi:hypothetical protein
MPSTSNPDEWSDDDVDKDGNNQQRGEDDQDKETVEDETIPTPQEHDFQFLQLNSQIKGAIEQLGGAVIPKLNWSAPKDASWMNQGSLKCETPGDVYLLLKSSDFILHDVLHALDDVLVQPTDDSSTTNTTTESRNEYPALELVLRKWCNLHSSMEFRCFVYDRQLSKSRSGGCCCLAQGMLYVVRFCLTFLLLQKVAISQRNHTLHFPHLADRYDDILLLIQEFLNNVVVCQFPLSKFVLDVYLDQQARIWILDFNVWGRQTDALLFDWDELIDYAEQTSGVATSLDYQVAAEEDQSQTFHKLIDFRLVETGMEVRQDPLASYRAPIDTIHLSSITGGDATKFQEFMRLCQRPS